MTWTSPATASQTPGDLHVSTSLTLITRVEEKSVCSVRATQGNTLTPTTFTRSKLGTVFLVGKKIIIIILRTLRSDG